MIEVDMGFGCCKKFYFYGEHSFKCMQLNAVDADFARGDETIRNISIEKLNVVQGQNPPS